MPPRTAVLILALLSATPAAADTVSEFTEIDIEADCAVVGRAADGEGDWANYVCPGYKGYPVILSYADARESIFYGFPPEGAAGFVWESFAAFNESSPRIEWRIDRQGDVETPFATIHRWHVADAADTDTKVDVLVVEKVGLLPEREGCAVAYVMASDNDEASDQARRLADEQARDFVCGDQPTVFSGDRQMPDFMREEN
ncbi:MAG: hypothetical protein K5872_23630 [Rhizobiaceae bacterium]|nr:hypothetical protein [Rhizobiaceae bacterium]MCV0409212.1 hypothetical protein [Rhizobiaceae bacterium]